MNTLVIDTNILISALISDGLTRKILTNWTFNFIFPEWGLEEVYSYKSEIIDKAKITGEEFDRLILRILKYIRLVPLKMVVEYREKALEIMEKIDPEDSVFIATALAFNCPIWSVDKHLKKQKEVKVFDTKELLEVFD